MAVKENIRFLFSSFPFEFLHLAGSKCQHFQYCEYRPTSSVSIVFLHLDFCTLMAVGDRESQAVGHWQCLRSTNVCQNDVADADDHDDANPLMLMTVNLLILMMLIILITI